MESLVSTFHLDVKLFVAQLINFGIIFFVLYRFAFKPLFKVVEERSTTIEKSLADAKEIEGRLQDSHKEAEDILKKAKGEAADFMEQAKNKAEENRQALVVKTKEELAQIVAKEKIKIEAMHQESLEEVKKELGSLVLAATEKVLAEKMTGKNDEELITKAIKSLKK